LDAFENQQPRLERIMEAMHFAADLGTRCVVVPMPKLPAMGEQPAEVPAGVFLFNKPPDRGETLRTSLTELGRLADRIGVRLALEVGQDSGAGVAAYLTQYDVGSLGVVLDPANFLMNRHDPHAAVMALHERLWLVHARDARLSGSTGPVEVPVGAGDLEWMSWIAGLAAVDYRGAVCVKQTVGENRKATLGTSIAFLRRFLPEAQM
jgi:sugar phosphate isomerase/epimerase